LGHDGLGAVSTLTQLRPEPEFPATDRFVVRRRLGEGAVGVVYHATDTERGLDIALKTLRKVDALGLYRFKREFRALADVVHPNLAALYELMSEAGEWFFTMELVDGVDFLTDIRPEGQLDERKLRHNLLQIARGVYAIHQAGKLHRDIKPSNVLVTKEGRVVILDFGLVTELGPTGSELGGRLRICGTAGYMAPEQAGALPLSEASDWYCVGVMLYEALTGTLPFLGTVEAVLKDKRTFEPPPPRALAKHVPADLERLTIDLLRLEPEDRPTGEAILDRLEPPSTPKVRAFLTSDESLVRKDKAIESGPRRAFIGRDEPMKRLLDLFDGNQDGDARFALVRGPSGMGKSALVRRVLDTIQAAQRATVLEGRCYERESVPFKGFDSVIDALCDHLLRITPDALLRVLPDDVGQLARLFPVLTRVKTIAARSIASKGVKDPLELRRRAFSSLRALLHKLAKENPLVIAIDDLQWGDADTAALLLDVLRPPRPPPILLIACQRDEDGVSDGPIAKLVRTLKDAARRARMVSSVPGGPETSVDAPVKMSQLLVEEVALDRLTEAEARELAYHLLGGSLKRSLAIAAESDGNPFFVTELVRFVKERAEGGVELESHQITLEELLTTRIEHLDEAARSLLEVIALAGRPIAQALATKAAKLPADDLGSLRMLRAQRLVKTRGGRTDDPVECFHDRVRETVQALISKERQRTHHAAFLAVLEEACGVAPPIDALAYHAEGAGDHPKAAKYAVLAADEASKALAFEHAARLYRRALRLDPLSAERIDLSMRLGDALANAGRGQDAARAYLAAAEHASGDAAIEAKRRAAEQFLRSGHVDDGLFAITDVLEGLDMRLTKTARGALASLLVERARLKVRGLRYEPKNASDIPASELMKIDVCWSVALGLSMIDVVRSTDFQARHLRLALEAGEPYRIARGFLAEGLALATRGRSKWPRVEAMIRDADAIAHRLDNAHAIGLSSMMAGMAHNLQGAWRRGLDRLTEALDVFESSCTGVAWEISTAEHMSIWALAYLGDMNALVERVPRALQEAERRGDRYAGTLFVTGLANLAWLVADDIDSARAAVKEGLSHWSQSGFHLQHYDALLAETHLDLYAGEGSRALDRLRASWTALEDSMLLEVQQIRIEAEHLHARARLAALAAVDPTERARHFAKIERIRRRIVRTAAPWALPISDLLSAGIAQAKGNIEKAARMYENARLGFLAQDMMLYAKVAERRKGELVGGEEGAAMVRASDRWMAQANIRRPPRFADMLAPVTSSIV
jgi:hypothetical protein